MKNMKTVEINQEPIELFKILKFEGLVPSGGMAKTVIADGQVSVNGVVDTRKRMKIMSGDVIEYLSLKYKVELK
jgi:ribosome-associated protein